MEERLVELEREAERLRQDVAALRSHFTERQQMDALRAESQTLRQAILRYALAYGAVELQMALMHSRHERTPDALEQLKQATEEEAAASRALCTLAQSLQMASQDRNPQS